MAEITIHDILAQFREEAMKDQSKPITSLRVHDLDNSPADWSGFSLNAPDRLKLQKKRNHRPHQKPAIDDVVTGLKKADRGKLIMACGTGKTFTSLCIAEEMAPGGHVLFLVPSLSLLSQTLREWTAYAHVPLHALAVCSDRPRHPFPTWLPLVSIQDHLKHLTIDTLPKKLFF